MLARLTRIAVDQSIDPKSKGWPKASNNLTRQLNILAASLATVGIIVETSVRTSHGRVVRIEKVAENIVNTVTGDVSPALSTLGDDGTDDDTPSSVPPPSDRDGIDDDDGTSGTLNSRQPTPSSLDFEEFEL